MSPTAAAVSILIAVAAQLIGLCVVIFHVGKWTGKTNSDVQSLFEDNRRIWSHLKEHAQKDEIQHHEIEQGLSSIKVELASLKGGQ